MCSMRLAVVSLALLLAVPFSPATPPSQAAEKPPYERLLRGDDVRKAADLEQQIRQLWPEAKFAEAAGLAEELLALRRRVQGEDHWQAVNARVEAETLRRFAGLPAEARRRLAEVPGLTAQQARLRQGGRPAEAEQVGRRLLALQEQILSKRHALIATTSGSVALDLEAQGKSAEAEPLHREALAILLDVLGERHPDTATGYSNVAMNLEAQGKSAEAEPLLRKALAIHGEVLGERHPDTARSYSNVAHNLAAQGKYAEAEPLCRMALAIRRQVLGEGHPDTARSYNNVAGNLEAQGRPAEAEPLLRQALAILRDVLGERHPDTATCYNNLALNLQAQARSAEAEPLLRKALAIHGEVLGERHPDTARSYSNVAHNLAAQGKYAEAEPLCRMALAIRRQVLGEGHPDTARSYNNVAGNLEARGRPAEAEPLCRKALAIFREVLGERHPDTARSHNNLARNLEAQGKAAEALKAWTAALQSYELSRLRVASRGLDRAAFAVELSPRRDLAVALARAGQGAEAWEVLEADLARGQLDEDSARRQWPADARQRLQALNARLDALQARQTALLADRRPLEQKQPELATLRDQRRQAEAELDALAAQLSQEEVWPLRKVQPRLPAGVALVAWVDVRDRSRRIEEHWAALLLPQGEPVWARLTGSGAKGSWSEDDEALPDRVRSALAVANGQPAPLLRRLRDQRLRPLEARLKEVRHLLVLPSPALLGVPVEALSDQWTVSYAASGTHLAKLAHSRPPRPPGGALLALGDPAFRPTAAAKPTSLPPHGVLLTLVAPGGSAARSGLKPGDVLLEYGTVKLNGPNDLKPQEGKEPIPVLLWRDGRSSPRQVGPGRLGVVTSKESAPVALKQQQAADAVLTRGSQHAPLPGTRREVEAIAKLFPEATVLLGGDASKSELAALGAAQLSGYRYLHLATHGEVNRAVAFSSALILADEPGKDDWQTRLTAAEMRETWRLDAELVTLSACDSGQGRAGGGEGLLGFSQALFLAGARGVLLSLWKVDDDATALLMQRFYQNLLGKRDGLKAPLPKAEALREAKAWLRELTREQAEARVKLLPQPRGPITAKATAAAAGEKPFAHPRYWAAFILIGDPD